jgi:carboxyl-terminal processing protease
LATLVVAGGLGVKANTSNEDSYKQVEVYSEVLSRIRTEYVEDPNVPAVTNGALHGLLESLDANSSYLDPAEYKDYKQRKNEGKATVGATLSKRFGYAAVVSVIPGGPADKAGVDSGDIIEAIEGKSTREMSLAEIDGILTGQPGSVINVSVVRPRKATPVKTPITREVVTEPQVSQKMLEDGIGYIKIDDFPTGRSQEVAAKLKELEKSGAKKLVLDLRNSGSGDESEGVATANLFLNHGMISYLQGQKYPKQIFNADPQKAVAPSIPLVVLVNRGTAGPAEIVAAAIMENARGDVIGDKTFGSGSIQKVIEMQDGSAIMLSVAKYYSPSGKALQDTAITPNILVADSTDDYLVPDEDENAQPDEKQQQEKEKKVAPDDQLKRAIDVLKNPAQKAA